MIAVLRRYLIPVLAFVLGITLSLASLEASEPDRTSTAWHTGGVQLRDAMSTDPRLQALTTAQQRSYWQSFARQYPTVDVSARLDALAQDNLPVRPAHTTLTLEERNQLKASRTEAAQAFNAQRLTREGMNKQDAEFEAYALQGTARQPDVSLLQHTPTVIDPLARYACSTAVYRRSRFACGVRPSIFHRDTLRHPAGLRVNLRFGDWRVSVNSGGSYGYGNYYGCPGLHSRPAAVYIRH